VRGHAGVGRGAEDDPGHHDADRGVGPGVEQRAVDDADRDDVDDADRHDGEHVDGHERVLDGQRQLDERDVVLVIVVLVVDRQRVEHDERRRDDGIDDGIDDGHDGFERADRRRVAVRRLGVDDGLDHGVDDGRRDGVEHGWGGRVRQAVPELLRPEPGRLLARRQGVETRVAL
jgi:hypothetical protein